jgi:hypothetical protein
VEGKRFIRLGRAEGKARKKKILKSPVIASNLKPQTGVVLPFGKNACAGLPLKGAYDEPIQLHSTAAACMV